ncbi:Alpha N-terminal protein methyltransferase 1 [Galdieria sulphuraria]|nr:Alpha N-terminal protein methyltransferase 1 [Galdieria sulphuraria]
MTLEGDFIKVSKRFGIPTPQGNKKTGILLQRVTGINKILPWMFLQGLQLPSTRIALDVGSGIGRVATELLTKMFEQVDLLEPNVHFLELAKQNVSGSQLGRVFRCSMQDFIPEVDRKYDLIWIQWCIIYLTDEDLVEFLKRCKSCLSASGLICIKDNVSRKHFVVDTNDASITRTNTRKFSETVVSSFYVCVGAQVILRKAAFGYKYRAGSGTYASVVRWYSNIARLLKPSLVSCLDQDDDSDPCICGIF